MGMVVTAVSDRVDLGFEKPRSGRVHSVFATSLNVELAGELVYLGADTAQLSSFGATLPEAETALLVSRAEPGDEVRLARGVMRVYSRAGVSELALSEARPVDLAIPRGISLPEGTDQALLAALAAVNLTERIGLPWPERSCVAVTELARFSMACLRMGEADAGEEDRARYDAALRAQRGSVAYLLGRGLGLTPSGDDVLDGFGTALHILCGESAWAAPFFETVAEQMPGKTTAVSEAYLKAMIAGYANEDYLALLDVLAGERFDELPRAVDRVLALGHTSGADSLLGFGSAFCCLL